MTLLNILYQTFWGTLGGCQIGKNWQINFVVKGAVVKCAVVKGAVVKGALVMGSVVMGAVVKGAVVKGVEHSSTNLKVNIWVARVRVPLVISVGIWIRKNSTSTT